MNKLKKIYKQRWNVEVFLKLLKSNFKFEHYIEHNKNTWDIQYKKRYLINLIIIYVSIILEKTKEFNNTNKTNNKHSIKKNKSNKTVIIKKMAVL